MLVMLMLISSFARSEIDCLPGVLRNKGTLANFGEQGNKIRKITVRKHSENVWEHGNIGQFWNRTREQGPPWETLEIQMGTGNEFLNFNLIKK